MRVPLYGFEDNYEVDESGNIYSLDRKILYSTGHYHFHRGRRMKLNRDRYGYLHFSTTFKNTRVDKSAHRLVWASFYGPIPDGLQINHKNMDPSDNRLENLELVTPSQNVRHSYSNNRKRRILKGSEVGNSRLKESDVAEIVGLIDTGLRYKDIAIKYGVSYCLISRIAIGKAWSSFTGRTYIPGKRARKSGPRKSLT